MKTTPTTPKKTTTKATATKKARASPKAASIAKLRSSVDDLPAAGAPTPPSTFSGAKAASPRGNWPKLAQIAMAKAVADELDANASEYVAGLGPNAPDPSKLAAAILLAIGWKGERDAADAWNLYCRVEEAKAWQQVMGSMSLVRQGLAYAASSGAPLSKQLPQLSKFVDLGAIGGRKAAASKKAGTNASKKKVAKAAATVARAAAKSAPAPVTPSVPPTGGAH